MDKPIKQSFNLPTIQDLFKAGFHFGHTTSKWNPKMSKYIYTVKNGIHIIDLNKTVEKFHEFVVALKECSEKGYVLVVGTKKQASAVVKEVCINSGMLYVVNRWPGGLLTNFDIVRKGIKEMFKEEEIVAEGSADYTKKELSQMKKKLIRKLFLYEGVTFMDSKPSAMVVIDGNIEKSAVREAKNLGIKLFGMVDTNCDPTIFDYIVPANDDATKAVTLFMNVISEVVSQSSLAKDIKARRALREQTLVDLKKKGEDERKAREIEREQQAEKMRAIKEGKKIAVSKEAIEGIVEKEAGYVDVDQYDEKPTENPKKKTVVKKVASKTKSSVVAKSKPKTKAKKVVKATKDSKTKKLTSKKSVVSKPKKKTKLSKKVKTTQK